MARDVQVKGDSNTASFDLAWKDVRADANVQFTPAAAPEPPVMPQWWTDFLDRLGDALRPVADGLVAGWPVIRILLLLLLAAGVLTLIWVILAPYVEQWSRGKPAAADEIWQPAEEEARELLAEAEALAEIGQFDQAVRLLLHRSIADIKKHRPDLLRPSSTSREIGRFDSLPDASRAMFAVIAGQVERGLFAALPIDEKGWRESRDAYAGFALRDSWQAAPSG